MTTDVSSRSFVSHTPVLAAGALDRGNLADRCAKHSMLRERLYALSDQNDYRCEFPQLRKPHTSACCGSSRPWQLSMLRERLYALSDQNDTDVSSRSFVSPTPVLAAGAPDRGNLADRCARHSRIGVSRVDRA